MLKRLFILMLVTVLSLSVITGCGSAKKTETSMADRAGKVSSDMQKDGNFGETVQSEGMNANEPKENEQAATAITGRGTAANLPDNAILSQRKVIRNANVSVEVEDFDKAYGQLKSIITGIGFIQESKIKRDKRYIDKNEILVTNAVIVIRVDKDKFERTLDDISGLGIVLDEAITSDDVTGKYFDTESRLRLLRFEESRLEEYLKKLTDPDVIFKTEDKLTEIRYEIESLTGTLKKWDDLVELSTITINLSEKIPEPAAAVIKEKTYWQRLGDEFVNSFRGAMVFLGEVLIFLVGALPTLIFLALLGLMALKVIKRYSGNIDKVMNVQKNKDENE